MCISRANGCAFCTVEWSCSHQDGNTCDGVGGGYHRFIWLRSFHMQRLQTICTEKTLSVKVESVSCNPGSVAWTQIICSHHSNTKSASNTVSKKPSFTPKNHSKCSFSFKVCTLVSMSFCVCFSWHQPEQEKKNRGMSVLRSAQTPLSSTRPWFFSLCPPKYRPPPQNSIIKLVSAAATNARKFWGFYETGRELFWSLTECISTSRRHWLFQVLIFPWQEQSTLNDGEINANDGWRNKRTGIP